MSAIPLPDAAPAIALPDDDEQLRRVMAIPVPQQQPKAVSTQGVPVTPQTQNHAIPINRATGAPEELNNQGKPIAPGVAGLWARAENIHNPILRTLGKIGAVGARAIDVAGSVAAPGIAAQIPGSTLNQEIAENRAEKQQTADTENEERSARTAYEREATQEMPAKAALENAQAEKALREPQEKPTIHETDQGIFLVGNDGKATPLTFNGEPLMPKSKPDTAVQNKQAFQSVVSKIDAAGLPTDEKSLNKSLDAALKAGKITPEEHQVARGYLAANPTPSTNLSVKVEGQQSENALQLDKMFEGKEVIAHTPDGRRVQMSYGDAKKQGVPLDQMTILNPKEAQDNRDKFASIKTTMDGLRNYRNDFKTLSPQLTANDKAGLIKLNSDVESGRVAGLLGQMFDDIPLAGPLNKYVNTLEDGAFTGGAYANLSPAGKRLLADYANQVVSNFANMKAIMGTVGRNPAMIQAEVKRIPLPYVDWDSASQMFDRTRDDIRGRAGSMPEFQ